MSRPSHSGLVQPCALCLAAHTLCICCGRPFTTAREGGTKEDRITLQRCALCSHRIIFTTKIIAMIPALFILCLLRSVSAAPAGILDCHISGLAHLILCHYLCRHPLQLQESLRPRASGRPCRLRRRAAARGAAAVGGDRGGLRRGRLVETPVHGMLVGFLRPLDLVSAIQAPGRVQLSHSAAERDHGLDLLQRGGHPRRGGCDLSRRRTGIEVCTLIIPV